MLRALFSIFVCCGTLACGPFFPPSYLNSGGYRVELLLAHELKLIAAHFEADLAPKGLKRAAAEEADFRAAVNALDLDTEKAEDLVSRYLLWQEAARIEVTPEPLLPMELTEFVLYVNGVREMGANPDKYVLPPSWKTLLDLPPERRRYRSLWVHYTRGNMAAKPLEKAAAHTHYQRVIDRADDFVDSCALAWAAGRKIDPPSKVCETLRNDLRKFANGYERAVNDVRVRGNLNTYNDEEIAALLADPICRELVAARAMAHAWSGVGNVLDRLGDRMSLSAERLAFLAYNRGDMALTEKALAQAPDDAVLKWWLMAKVQRSRGETSAAAASMRRWLERYEEKSREVGRMVVWEDRFEKRGLREEVRGSLGMIMIEERDFVEALDCFLRAGSWVDAATVAERLLPVTELKAYVDAQPAVDVELDEQLPAAAMGTAWVADVDQLRAELRYLLGRRLAREGDVDAGLLYLPPAHIELAKRYAGYQRVAELTSAPKNVRALAFYVGGSWLKGRAKEEANDFYRRLVRVGNQPLARRADTARWFTNEVSDELTEEMTNTTPRSFDQLVHIGRTAAE